MNIPFLSPIKKDLTIADIVAPISGIVAKLEDFVVEKNIEASAAIVAAAEQDAKAKTARDAASQAGNLAAKYKNLLA